MIFNQNIKQIAFLLQILLFELDYFYRFIQKFGLKEPEYSQKNTKNPQPQIKVLFCWKNITYSLQQIINQVHMTFFQESKVHSINNQSNYNLQFQSATLVGNLTVKIQQQSKLKIQEKHQEHHQQKQSRQQRIPKQRMPLSAKQKKEMTLFIKDLMDKYLIKYDDEDCSEMIQKMEMVRKRINGYLIGKESLSAVVYSQYSDVFRGKTTKEFCTRNGLKTSRFNKNYKAYHELFIRPAQAFKEDSTEQCFQVTRYNQDQGKADAEIKQQDIIEEEDAVAVIVQEMKEPMPVTPINMLNLIYDHLFKSNNFQEHRRSIISKLIVVYEQVYVKEFDRIFAKQSQQVKIFHVIFYMLKIKLDFNISFNVFNDCVFKQIGCRLSLEYKDQMNELAKTSRYENSRSKRYVYEPKNMQIFTSEMNNR